MSKPQIYKITKSVKITEDCNNAWIYLDKLKCNPAYYFSEGGEKYVIQKALEMNMNIKREKEYPNHPDWLFDK